MNLFTFRQRIPNFVSRNLKLHNIAIIVALHILYLHAQSFSFFKTSDFLRGRGPNYKWGDKSSLSFLRFSTVFLNVKVAKNDQKRPKMANSVSAVNSFIRACHLDQFIHLVLTSFFKLPIFPAEEGRAANEGIKVLRLSKT